MRGLGDWVDGWAKPIARWIDARVLPMSGLVYAGRLIRRPAKRPADPVLAWLVGLAVKAGLVTVPLAGCSACSRRRRWLNQVLTDLRSPRAWLTGPGRLWRLLRPAGNALAKPPPRH